MYTEDYDVWNSKQTGIDNDNLLQETLQKESFIKSVALTIMGLYSRRATEK